MKEGKRGLFAVTVFLSAISNYYFFIGQAVFLVIYWIIRAVSGDWERLGMRFFGIAFEAVTGTAMAAVLLLPSFYAVTQNPRTDNIIAGWDLLLYNKPQREINDSLMKMIKEYIIDRKTGKGIKQTAEQSKIRM